MVQCCVEMFSIGKVDVRLMFNFVQCSQTEDGDVESIHIVNKNDSELIVINYE